MTTIVDRMLRVVHIRLKQASATRQKRQKNNTYRDFQIVAVLSPISKRLIISL